MSTPPEPSARIKALHARVLAQVDQMIAMANGPEETLAKSAPSVSAWSVLQHLDHNGRVLGFIAMMAIEGAIKDPPSNPEGRPKFAGRVLLALGWLPRGKGKAPDSAAPRAKNAEELRKSLTMVRPFIERLGAKLGQIENSKGRTPHPMLGAFSAAQWLKFLEIHTHHHMKIIRDIQKA